MGAGAKNHDIAELANRSQDIIVTFDDDFLRLKPNTKSPLKVIYIRLHPRDPRKAQEILDKWINECLKILDHTNLVTLSESGPTERHE
jgi:predicted nuclease of predicted toxin-antitoxin system